jgi:hypothetical protein
MANAKLSSNSAVWAYPIFIGIGLASVLLSLLTAAQMGSPPEAM